MIVSGVIPFDRRVFFNSTFEFLISNSNDPGFKCNIFPITFFHSSMEHEGETVVIITSIY